ncbi:MAG: glutamate racemase [bacterium]|nr:glutamate racemase [bacterium]
MNNKKAIGIFDSGIGGLTVLHSIIKALPAEDTIYVGDTARVPYGTKSVTAVTNYSLEIGRFLEKMDIKALVVACNTASAVALPKLKEAFNIPVIDMIDPAAGNAVETTQNGHIGVIGTEGTIKSGAYENKIKTFGQKIEVTSIACPLFVPLAEEGWIDNDVALAATRIYLEPFKRSKIDTLILGCTHYPLLKDTIREVIGDKIALIDSGETASLCLKEILKSEKKKEQETVPRRSYFVTDTPDRFLRLGKRFLGDEIDDVRHIDIP